MGIFVSFDVSSDFGFFKKPDINEFGLTYNLPPKPAILGMIGGVLGMNGLGRQYDNTVPLQEILKMDHSDYDKVQKIMKKINLDVIYERLDILQFKYKEKLVEILEISEREKFDSHKEELKKIITELKSELVYPEYYKKLQDIKVGIKPLGEFPFNKIMNKYNSNNSYFNGKDNAIISEQLLIKPTYRIYLYEEKGKILSKLVNRLKNNDFVFMTYLGKNEFIASFKNIKNINVSPIPKDKIKKKIQISSVFLKIKSQDTPNQDGIPIREDTNTVSGLPQGFVREYYPIGYSANAIHYELQVVEYTSRSVESSNIDLDKGVIFNMDGEVLYLF